MTTTTVALSGVSHSSGTLTLTAALATGAFADFAFARGPSIVDPYISHILNQAVDVSSSSSEVRVSVTATAPTNYAPYAPQGTVAGRAAYAGIAVQESAMKGSGSAYIDHAQFEPAASTTLLSASAEGYDDGMFYALEPGVGALWERSQEYTNTGLWSGHFIASPAYSGNTYQRVATIYSSYNQLLAGNTTYADVLNGTT